MADHPVDDELLAIFRDEVGDQLARLGDRLEQPPSRWRLDELFRIAHNVKGASRMVGADVVQRVAHRLEDLFSVLRDAEGVLDRDLVALARDGAVILGGAFERLGTEPSDEESGRIEDFAGSVGAVLGKPHSGRPHSGRQSDSERRQSDSEADSETDSETDQDSSRQSHSEPGQPERQSDSESQRQRGQQSDSEPDSEPEQATEAESDAPRRSGRSGDTTLRVPVSKLDQLLGFGSDLVHQDARSRGAREQAAELCGLLDRMEQADPEVRRMSGWGDLALRARRLRSHLAKMHTEQERLSRGLRDASLSLRMLPLRALTSVLQLTLREACRHAGRTAELRVEGGDTEIDRAVLDVLRDPLVHLVRNAVAHGLEPADERRAAGKSAVGVVQLAARADGSWVAVDFSDDGRGLDQEAIRDAARRRGLAVAERAEDGGRREGDALDQVIFRPGFSTAETADDMSGRGVGLDVVREAVESLGGVVSVHSRPGHGTTFRLRVPASRLTSEGLLVRVGRRRLVLPGAASERTIRVEPSAVGRVEGRLFVRRGEDDGARLELQRLDRLLGLPESDGSPGPAVVLSDGARRKALWVDEVIGRVELMVQPLPWNLHGLPGVAACTVLDGERIVPILDASALLGSHVAATDSALDATPRRRRILVADDSVTSRTLENNILTSAGFETLVAVNGEEAWDLLKTQDVDLLVSDVDMPKLSGIELTQRVRADPNLATLPVVLVTSLTGDHRRRGAEAGADAYIVKGEFDQDDLLEAIDRLL